MEKQQKVQQKLNKQEIEKMLNEQKNVLTKEDINKFFTENLKKSKLEGKKIPNWTNNIITFESEEDCKKVWEAMGLETFAKKALPDGNYVKYKTKRFTYEAVIPSPKTKKECPEEYLMNEESHSQALEDRPWFDWYKWNNNNWGVKWDACDAYQDHYCINFDSPWSKPYNKVFQAIADKFNVSFFTEHSNEDGGWEEYEYYYSPHQPMYAETDQWQVEENQRNWYFENE